MNDRAKPARSREQSGNTPLSEWGSEVGDYQDSADIDDAFAELLEKSPVRSSEDGQPDRVDETRLSADDLPGADRSEPESVEVERETGTTTAPIATGTATDVAPGDDADAPKPDEGTFSLLGYLLESSDDDHDATVDAGPTDPHEGDLEADLLPVDTSTFVLPDAVDASEERVEETKSILGEGLDAPEETDINPADVGLVIVERSTVVDTGAGAVDREPEPGFEFAPPSQRHPGDLAGSTLYSSDDYEGQDDTQENDAIAGSFWDEPSNSPAWHPDAPTNLQHSAVVQGSWDVPALPSRSVRSPGERRRPQTALDVVGDLTDRPGFWKSVAAVAVVAVSAASYSVGFFDEVLGRGGQNTAAQVVRSGATLPEAELQTEPPDALGDLRSALTGEAADLEITTGSGGDDDEPAAPARRVQRASTADVTTSTATPASEPTTSQNSPTTKQPTTTAPRSTSTVAESSKSTSTSTSTTTARRPTTARPPATTTTTTEATTTTKKTPPSRGRTTTSTTRTTASTTTSVVTSTTEPSTSTSVSTPTTEATTTTTEATTSTTEAGGGE